KRPVSSGWYLLIHAVVVNVFHNADNLTPVVFSANANTLAERISRVAPILACEALRNQGDGNPNIRIGSGQVAPCNERRAQRSEKSLRDKLMVAYRRNLSLGIREVFDEDGILPSASAHRN